MSLKYKAKTKDEIPIEHQSLYVERDGVWTLNVDGALAKSDFPEPCTTDATKVNQTRDRTFGCPTLVRASPLAPSVKKAGTPALRLPSCQPLVPSAVR